MGRTCRMRMAIRSGGAGGAPVGREGDGMKRDHDFYVKIGSKGGTTTFRRHGREHYSRIGEASRAAQHQLTDEERARGGRKAQARIRELKAQLAALQKRLAEHERGEGPSEPPSEVPEAGGQQLPP